MAPASGNSLWFALRCLSEASRSSAERPEGVKKEDEFVLEEEEVSSPWGNSLERNEQKTFRTQNS